MDRKAKVMNETVLTDQILRDAENWHASMSTGTADLGQKQLFKTWYDDSPLHQQAYAQVFMCADAGIDMPSTQNAAANDNVPIAKFFGAIAAMFLITFFGYSLLFSAPDFTEYTTQTAEIRPVELADGTIVTLGASSAISVADFSGDTRQIIMEKGEALFDVAHDADKPFFVISGDTTLQVLGTKFTVNTSANHVSVSLLSGSLEVRQITEASLLPFLEKEIVITLKPDQSVTVSHGTMRMPTTKESAQMANWVEGTRSYFDTPLSLVIADINRYSTKPITIAGPQAGNLLVTLVFGSEQIDTVLQNLPQILPVSIFTDENGTIIRDTK